MTEVEFHTGVPDTLDFACRLLRKAARQGARVWVTAPAEVLQALDRALWVFDERDFVPHVRMPGAAPAVAARTPLWLAEARPAQASAAGDAAGASPSVLVNLGADPPQPMDGLTRLIEIVSAEPEAAAGGRARWLHYKSLGLAIRHHGEGAARG